MIRKLILPLFIQIFFVSIAFSQQIFSLKGKSIIVPPTVEQYTNSVYTEQVLKNYEFKQKYIYAENILGERVDVLDVLHINKGKKKEAILVVLNHKNNKVVLYMPMQIKMDTQSLCECFYSAATEEVNIFNITYITTPNDIVLYHYDSQLLDSIYQKFQNKNLYLTKEPYSGMTWQGELKPQVKYQFKGIAFNRNCHFRVKSGTFPYHTEFQTLSLILQSPQGYTFIPIKIDSIFGTDIEYSYWNLRDSGTYLSNFSLYFQTEEEYIESSKKQYLPKFINQLRHEFEGKSIYLDSNNYVGKGYYFLREISLTYSNSNDIFLKYYAILEDSCNNRTYLYPINKDFHENVILAEVQRKIEEEEARKQSIKEAEYSTLLDKEEQEYKSSLIKRFGRKNASIILENAVKIGFTKEMCIEAWGDPYDVNRTITHTGVHEQWVYGIGRYLYFEGDILTAIQD